jgi:hypothetical protein
MLASKEKLEDLRWRDELLSLLAVAVKNYGLTGEQHWKDLAKETGEESQKINNKLKTYDYAPKQVARQQHFKDVGPHDCPRFD